MIVTILNAICLLITLVVVVLFLRFKKRLDKLSIIESYLDVLDVILNEISNVDMEDIMQWKEEVDDALENI